MDIVLGVSMAPGTVRLVAIEGQDADGVTVEQEEFEVGSAGSAVDRVIDAISGTREGVVEGGHRLSSTGVTWTNPADVAALRQAINASDLGDVMMVAPLLAAAALAQTVGYALAYERIAMLFVESASATLAVVEVGDGSIVDLHRRRITDAAAPAELATMVAGLEAGGSGADGVFIVGCGTDIVALKPAIEATTSLRVTGPEEPDMALARGAALASANAPLFASSTAALAYALDPGTGEFSPPALGPSYLDVWGEGGTGTGFRAYSALADEVDETEEHKPPRRSRAMLLAGSALAGIAAVIAGVVLVTLTSDKPTGEGHNAGVNVATPGIQLPAAPPSSPPQAQPPAPSTTPPAPAPPAEVAAPAPAPAPVVQQPAPQTTATSKPPAPVYRAPTRQTPQYVPQPVEKAAPPPAAPPPAAPPAAPPPPPPAAPPPPRPAPVTMYLHFPFVTVPIPITPPAPPPPP
ncbi:DUF7159 family protein [Mycobacterium marseillense]|uniref:DUF7159 domain-containing protein n=2 Tax=Mycobacterium marseillense TaxID=701042 RepID=A0ABM7JEJ9_9MYCO|nr:hypothetical protein [Mycobacterium marseillense]MCV7404049.1 hypothetical protein [Mycobacterium marseillense]BBY12386.1 hypothetical protein MMARJ_31260 [Mycobacterium marseillense]